MKLAVLDQYGKGVVQCEVVLGEAIRNQIARLKWSLWHGQVDKALGKIDDLEISIEPFHETYARFPRLVKALSELRTYIVNNRPLIPNDGERYHNGEAPATGFVESTVHEVVGKRCAKNNRGSGPNKERIGCYRRACGHSTGSLAPFSSAGIRSWLLKLRKYL